MLRFKAYVKFIFPWNFALVHLGPRSIPGVGVNFFLISILLFLYAFKISKTHDQAMQSSISFAILVNGLVWRILSTLFYRFLS